MKFKLENPFGSRPNNGETKRGPKKKELPWGEWGEPYYEGGQRRIDYRRDQEMVALIENARTQEKIRQGIESFVQKWRDHPLDNWFRHKGERQVIEHEMFEELSTKEEADKAKRKLQEYILFDIYNVPEIRVRSELLELVHKMDNPSYVELKQLWLQVIEELLPEKKWDYQSVLEGRGNIDDLSEEIRDLVESLIHNQDKE